MREIGERRVRKSHNKKYGKRERDREKERVRGCNWRSSGQKENQNAAA